MRAYLQVNEVAGFLYLIDQIVEYQYGNTLEHLNESELTALYEEMKKERVTASLITIDRTFMLRLFLCDETVEKGEGRVRPKIDTLNQFVCYLKDEEDQRFRSFIKDPKHVDYIKKYKEKIANKALKCVHGFHVDLEVEELETEKQPPFSEGVKELSEDFRSITEEFHHISKDLRKIFKRLYKVTEKNAKIALVAEELAGKFSSLEERLLHSEEKQKVLQEKYNKLLVFSTVVGGVVTVIVAVTSLPEFIDQIAGVLSDNPDTASSVDGIGAERDNKEDG